MLMYGGGRNSIVVASEVGNATRLTRKGRKRVESRIQNPEEPRIEKGTKGEVG